jgi:hypothetical protein
MQSLDELAAEIDQRNVLRQQAGLPLLEIDVEVQRRKDADHRAEFERYFEQHRHRFEHLWSVSNDRGFLANMGIWTTVRRILRDEMLINRVQRTDC